MALLLFGCAAAHDRDKEIDRLSRRVTELKRSLDESNSRLEDLNNKFFLLREKVDSNRASVRSFSEVPSSPPEGLSVVSLGEEGKSRDVTLKTGAGKDGAAGKKALKKAARTEAASGAKGTTGVKAAGAPEKTESERKTEKGADKKGADALYSRGQDLFMAGDFDRARKVFKSLADTYPGHTLADNALYWLGESYYSEQDYQSALLVFQVVVKKYPAENKAPDALLKMGYSYIEIEELEKAKEAFNTLFSRYPDTEAAIRGKKTYKELFG